MDKAVRCFVVINPRSGTGLDHEDFPAKVREWFAAADVDAVYPSAGATDIAAQLQEARDSGIGLVAVAGGDGTIMAGAEAFAGTDTVLAVIPAGTMNVLAHELEVPLAIPDAIRLISEGEVRAIDVGEVNGHIFIGSSILGAPSRLARRRERFRGKSTGRSYARLLRAGIRALVRYPAVGVTIHAGHEHKPVRTRALAVVVNDYAEGFGKVLTRSSLDGGKLVLYALKPITPWHLIRLLVAMVMGRWRHDRYLQRLTVETVKITAHRKRIRLMNDGETLLVSPPLDYRIRPKALRVLGPRSVETDVPTANEEPTLEATASR
ncbi:diacylglycerol/lipid kinase family protein [Amorphus sp. MBR-141]